MRWLLVSLVCDWINAAMQQPLAVKIPGAFTSADIDLIHKATRAARIEFGDENLQRRQFGLGEEAEGHTVVFLQGVLDDVAPHVRRRLWDLAMQIDSEAGWNVTQGLDFYNARDANKILQGAATARCVEYVSYTGGARSDGQDKDSVGWHSDGGTLITMVIMLSAPDSFEGGSIEFMDDDGEQTTFGNFSLSQGDAIGWRGWTSHFVQPVTSGHREVVVVEWWSGEDCAESDIPRGADTVEGLQHAITLDPKSSFLQTTLGAAICKRRAACASEDDAQKAEKAFREAVSLAPRNPRRLQALGRFLGNFETYHHLREACVMESDTEWLASHLSICALKAFSSTARHILWPTSTEVPEDTAEVDKVAVVAESQDQVWKLFMGAPIALVLWWLIKKLERISEPQVRRPVVSSGRKAAVPTREGAPSAKTTSNNVSS